MPPLRTLLSAERIATRVAELGAEVTRDYAQRPLVLVCVLRGSFIFAADLARAIPLPLRVDFLGVQSYGDAMVSSGAVQITQDLYRPIQGEHVVIVEDLIDTGLTLEYLVRQLESRGALSVEICALLRKPARAAKPVRARYVGFEIEDEFAVGYGLDHAQRHRNLPHIAVVEARSTETALEH